MDVAAATACVQGYVSYELPNPRSVTPANTPSHHDITTDLESTTIMDIRRMDVRTMEEKEKEKKKEEKKKRRKKEEMFETLEAAGIIDSAELLYY